MIFQLRLLNPLTAIFLSLAILNLSSCTYVKLHNEKKEDFINAEKNLPENKTLYVYSEGSLLQISSFEITEEGIFSGQYTIPSSELSLELRQLIEEDKNQVSREKRKVKDAVIIKIPQSAVNASMNRINFKMADVESLYTIDPQTGKMIILVIAGLATASAILIAIIILTKSSCPFVHSYDANGNISFNGEIYGGAIFKPLERKDFMPLVNLQPDKQGRLQLVVSNQLKETQYINELKLWAVAREAGEEILWQSNGKAVAVKEEWKAVKASDDNNYDVSYLLAESDNKQFSFTETKGELFENLNLKFDNLAEEESLYLKLDLKNSLWLDQLWLNFTKHFGTYYNTWADKQNTVPRKEMEQWNREQGINLEVQVKRNGNWEVVETLECIGPLAYRQLIIPMPAPENGKLEVRLKSGLMFWDIDQASLIKGEQKQTFAITLNEAHNNEGADAAPLIHNSDEQYLIQENVGDSLFLNFDHKVNTPHSYCLEAQGYYLHQRNFTNSPDRMKLLSFQAKEAFVKYSREVLNKYKLQLQHEGS